MNTRLRSGIAPSGFPQGAAAPPSRQSSSRYLAPNHNLALNLKLNRDHPHPRRPAQDAYLLIEVLVYIAVLMALLGAAYAAMYRGLDSSIALRRNADEITSALHAGELWRADLRAASSQPRLEPSDAGQLLHLDGSRGPVVYRFYTNTVCRRLGEGPWVSLLPRVKASTMTPDPRQHVTAWRWELELQPRQSGSVKPSRIRPLFTFTAVPEKTAPK